MADGAVGPSGQTAQPKKNAASALGTDTEAATIRLPSAEKRVAVQSTKPTSATRPAENRKRLSARPVPRIRTLTNPNPTVSFFKYFLAFQGF